MSIEENPEESSNPISHNQDEKLSSGIVTNADAAFLHATEIDHAH
jgi:hypothetical protein